MMDKIEKGEGMEVKKDFNLRKIAGEYILMPKDTSQNTSDLISLNEVEALVWKNLQDCKDEDEMLSLITSTYMVQRDIAKKDLGNFLKQLEEADII